MAQRYEVVVWQNVPKGAAGSEESAFSGSIVRRRLDDGEATGASGAFVTFNERNAGLAASYERIRRHTQPIAASVFEVREWDAAGPDGLLIDRAGGRCLIGDALGWSQSYAQWYTEQVFGAVWDAAGGSFTADIPEPRIGIEGVFASAPGQGVYGHWLLDYVPRFHAMLTHGVALERVHAWPAPGWATTFTKACGVTLHPLQTGDRRATWRLAAGVIPGFLKVGYTVQPRACRSAWEAFAGVVLGGSEEMAPVSARKLFVTRSRLKGDTRSLANAAEIEAIARNRGFAVLAPEAYSIEAQARIFHDADIVVGQDGSALHNVIFCRKGTHLGVINLPERCNLWHASICDALGHRIAYAEASESAGVKQLHLGEFRQLLSALENSMKLGAAA